MPVEILPGVLHWTAVHPNLGREVSSYFVTGSATLVDPMRPDDGGDLEPERVVLTARHHLRASESFGAPILCHESGLHQFENGPEVRGFAWGDLLAPDVTALEVDAIAPDETALLIDAGDGALSLGDVVIRYADDIHFVPDNLIVDEGDDPEPVKAAMRAALARLLDHPFDSLLLAHGSPVVGGGKEALRRFVER
jgi:hypothetical protein